MTKRCKSILAVVAALLCIGGGLILVETQLEQPMGLFTGTRPTDLGFKDGKFKPCSWKPNCVSSTTDKADTKHYIAPLTFTGSPEAAWAKLKGITANIRKTSVVADSPNYRHVEFTSATMGFVDDVEFALDAGAGVIHVRSASRLGIGDGGVNRKRVESLRSALGTN